MKQDWILGVAGYSNAGKTTLIERLLPRLTAAGLRVAVIKHDGHGGSFDTAGRDTARFAAAGAAVTAITSAQQTALFMPQGSSLSALLRQLPAVDLVLVEGFKGEAIRQIGVCRAGIALPDAPARYAAIVTDAPFEAAVTQFAHDETAALAEWILQSRPAAQTAPSTDEWLREAKANPAAAQCGMFLFHNGTVRCTAKKQVREQQTAAPVTGMLFSYDRALAEAAVERAKRLPGIYYVRVWLNEGRLSVGDDIMLVLIGGDIRPHVTAALDILVGELKNYCVAEQELSE